ncbi:MAG: adenylate/guanylate cyclase domain-containing protein [Nitrospirae bacterium]|nr:adenylate/guanylate cyclase domain-containing protein [Nitrospirota bacterium]
MSEITTVIVDMVGSTQIEQDIGIKGMTQIKNELMESISTVANRTRGRIANFFGDGALIIFKDQDSIFNACFFISKLLSQLSEENTNTRGKYNPIHLKCGIDHGNVSCLNDGVNLSGMPINISARLANICKPDQVLVASPIAQLGKKRGMSFSAGIIVNIKGIGKITVYEFK